LAGWDLHPLESAALSRRTVGADIYRCRRAEGLKKDTFSVLYTSNAALSPKVTAIFSGEPKDPGEGIGSMTVWIVLVLALFFVQSTLAPFVQWRSNVRAALGPRDNAPPMPVAGARLERAFRNMIEAILLFIPLALLAEIQGGADGLAKAGAAVFFFARVL
jgi:uncharacterized MAPEG superfamily protein